MATLLRLAFLLAIAAPAFAQEALVSERPSFSASSVTVSDGAWQAEFGFRHIRIDGDANLSVFPEFLLRFGLSDETELQIEWAGYIRQDFGMGSDSGPSDVSIGGKWSLSDAADVTKFAFLASLSIPVGDDQFSTDSYDPRIALAWSHSGGLEWFGTLAARSTDGDTLISNGVGLSFSIDEASGWFIEHEMNIPERGGTLHALNGGWTMLRNPTMQFDVHGSVGLNDRAPDFALGLGMAVRF